MLYGLWPHTNIHPFDLQLYYNTCCGYEYILQQEGNERQKILQLQQQLGSIEHNYFI